MTCGTITASCEDNRSTYKAEPGGTRGTVELYQRVIVRTRVGFGVSLVGGGARVHRCSNGRDQRPKRPLLATPRCALKSINFNQPPEANPITHAQLSGLPWLPGTTATGSDGPCGLSRPGAFSLHSARVLALSTETIAVGSLILHLTPFQIKKGRKSQRVGGRTRWSNLDGKRSEILQGS